MLTNVKIIEFDDNHKHLVTSEDFELIIQGKLKICRRCLVGVY